MQVSLPACPLPDDVRVYLPVTFPMVRDALALGTFDVDVGYGVTPTLREWYASGDAEELEYAATSDAARASLRLLLGDSSAARRRAVVAAEVGDALPDAELGRSGVR